MARTAYAEEGTSLPHTTVTEGAKERIVAAAVKLFSSKGFHATPVREICEAARVTKPVLYYYFRNKEDLFLSILRETLGRFQTDLREACDRRDDDFAAQINAVAQVYIAAAQAAPDLVRFINSIAFSGVYDQLYDFHEYWMGNVAMIEDLFARAQRKGCVRKDLSPRTLALHFNGTVLSVMRGLVYFPQCLEGYPLENGIADLVLRGIGATNSVKTRSTKLKG